MSADWRQQEELEQEREAEICGALARVCLGLGGRKEAEILASALGSRFSSDNAVNHERKM